MKEHKVKISPNYFADAKKGIKNFELRKFDRDYQVGDILTLEEWDPDEGHTGQAIRKRIRYVLADCEQHGLMDGYCILGLD